MKLLLPILLAIAASINVFAAVRHGVVTDEQGNPIEFVTVAALSDSTVTASALTDSVGAFNIDISEATKRLRLTMAGFNELSIPTTDFPSDGRFVLKSLAKTLGEVTVTASPVKFEADRFILNINSDPFAKGKDMAQVLQTAPGVILDRRSISILGNPSTQVYINDRRIKLSGEQLFNYLQSLQSSAVTTVEIIPTADAEYSASYTGGIIKIQLKKERNDGYSGSATLSTNGGHQIFSVTPSANVGYHQGKTTLNIVASVQVTPMSKGVASGNSSNTISNVFIASQSRSRQHSLSPNILLSAYFDFDKRNTFGVEAEYKFNSRHYRNLSYSLLSGNTLLNDTETTGSFNTRSHGHNTDARLNYTRYIDSKKSYLKLIGGVSYNKSVSKENNEMTQAGIDSLYNVDTRSDYTSLNIEGKLFKKFSKAWSLTAGVKYTHNIVSNKSFHNYFDISDWVEDTRYDYDADYREDITALYVTVPGKIRNFSLRAGLRGEFFSTSGSGLDRHEFGLFPSLSLSHPMSRNGAYTVSATWTRRVRRPTFWQLSPLVRQWSDYNYSVGNIDLKSSITNTIALRFILARNFTLSLSYSDMADPIRQAFSVRPDFPERNYLTYTNMGRERNLTVAASGRFAVTKKWTLGGTLAYLNQNQRPTESSHFEAYNVFQGNIYSFLSLPRQFNLSVNALYISESHIGNISVGAISSVSLTLSKTFAKRWNVSVSGNNLVPLKSKTTTRDTNFSSYTEGRSYPSVGMSLSYSFSSGKSFKKKKIESNIDSSRFEEQ